MALSSSLLKLDNTFICCFGGSLCLLSLVYLLLTFSSILCLSIEEGCVIRSHPYRFFTRPNASPFMEESWIIRAASVPFETLAPHYRFISADLIFGGAIITVAAYLFLLARTADMMLRSGIYSWQSYEDA